MTIPCTVETPREKLQGYEFYRRVLGSPKYVVGPMVDQSELLVYTPMINAKMFMDETHKTYREQNFDIASGEEGAYSLQTSLADIKDTDRPLIIQFCANSPEKLLAAAKLVEAHCDAIDINLGCPQEIARKGHYGAFLMEEWDLIYEMINILHRNLSVPVTAKFRVYEDIERTVAYARMLESAGAQILTCHGRRREQRGQDSGLASYEHIRAVKAAVSVPVFANGNILFSHDIPRCLSETGADAVMSAEGVLYNPALFKSFSSSLEETNLPVGDLALEYLAIVRAQRTRTSLSAVKGHLFKILRPALKREPYWDLRERLGRVRTVSGKRSADGEEDKTWIDEYQAICEEAKKRLDVEAEETTNEGRIPLKDLVTTDPDFGLSVLPHWLAQPYFRPPRALVEKARKAKTGQTDAHAATVKDGPSEPEVAEAVGTAA
ncbi:hypothetical protein H0H92_002287 [Tricholoma furcatifolium]|nr:hypothetical protein H0H92_002287 [Tricholoma furcatifolium]